MSFYLSLSEKISHSDKKNIKIIKKTIYNKYPEFKDNIEHNIILTYCIHGAYYASFNNPNADTETIIRVLTNAVKALQPLYEK